MRCVYVPNAWRILPADETNVPDDHVPSCPDCGTPFVEYGRDGILVCFSANCSDRHDPAPPPKRARPESGLSEADLRRQADLRSGRQTLIQMWLYELEEVLAARLNTHKAHLREFISDRRKADGGLRTRIAAVLEAIGCEIATL